MKEKRFIKIFILTAASIVACVFFISGVLLAADTVTLRVAHNFPVKHPYSTACDMLAKEVKEKTNGKVIFKHFPGGQLGTGSQIFDQAVKGTIDLTPSGPTAAGKYYDPMNALQVFYLVDSPQQLLKIMEGPIGQKLFEQCRLKTGLKILPSILYYGRRSILTANKPIYKPEDLKGLKLRSMTSAFMKKCVQSMGATAVPIPMGELYMALQTGVVDGLENTPVTVTLQKWYEVAKYYSLTGHSIHPSLWNFNGKSWQNKVPDYAKPIILEAVKHVTEWEIDEMLKREGVALKELEKKGLKVIEVDRELFRKAVQQIYPELEKRFGPVFKGITQAAAQM